MVDQHEVERFRHALTILRDIAHNDIVEGSSPFWRAYTDIRWFAHLLGILIETHNKTTDAAVFPFFFSRAPEDDNT